MSLGSVFQTAQSGMSAAQFAVGVSANNVANAHTNGFKASKVSFASGRSQAVHTGSAPSGKSGGKNPVSVGAGVMPAVSSPDATQGTIAIAEGSTNLALEGKGTFILAAFDADGDMYCFSQTTGESRFILDTSGDFGQGPVDLKRISSAVWHVQSQALLIGRGGQDSPFNVIGVKGRDSDLRPVEANLVQAGQGC